MGRCFQYRIPAFVYCHPRHEHSRTILAAEAERKDKDTSRAGPVVVGRRPAIGPQGCGSNRKPTLPAVYSKYTWPSHLSSRSSSTLLIFLWPVLTWAFLN